MFEYKTMDIPMVKRKWFIDINGGLSDLNQFDRFYSAFEKETDKFCVAAHLDCDTDWVFGRFDFEDEAREYIKKIHDFLIAE